MRAYFTLTLPFWTRLGLCISAVIIQVVALDVHLFTMQKNSEFLHDWVHYHGHIFGYHHLTIIDTDSNSVVKKQLMHLIKLGVTVHFRTALGFRDKMHEMSEVMRPYADQTSSGSMLVPLDIDEFVVAVQYGGDRYTTFSLQKSTILDMFDSLPRPAPDQQRGMKFKFNTFEAIDCTTPFNTQLQSEAMKHHSLSSFVEDKESYSRCNAKTFYASDGFSYTDDGNHYGEVKNQSKHCFTKYKCQKCYEHFMKSRLGLLHYSSYAMTYNEIKTKMLDRLSALPQFRNITTLQNCTQFKKNIHYCKFNAQLLRHGDQHMADKLHAKRQQRCSQGGVFQRSAPAVLFKSYHHHFDHTSGHVAT